MGSGLGAEVELGGDDGALGAHAALVALLPRLFWGNGRLGRPEAMASRASAMREAVLG